MWQQRSVSPRARVCHMWRCSYRKGPCGWRFCYDKRGKTALVNTSLELLHKHDRNRISSVAAATNMHIDISWGATTRQPGGPDGFRTTSVGVRSTKAGGGFQFAKYRHTTLHKEFLRYYVAVIKSPITAGCGVG